VGLFAALLTDHWETGFSIAFFTALAIHIVAKLSFAVEATRQINADQQSGALELLLVTTLSERSILEGHLRALEKLSHRSLLLLASLNLVLEFCVLAFQDQLHMDSFAIAMFTSLFLGGMVLAGADFWVLRWLALLKGLQASHHAKAAALAFCWTMILPWIGIAAAFAVVTDQRPSEETFVAVVWCWIAFCLIYDLVLARQVGQRLRGRLRRMVSERA
jgi:hypothetical protein